MKQDYYSTSKKIEGVLSLLIELGTEYAFDPLSSDESRCYFEKLLDHFQGDSSNLRNWLQPIISQDFRCLSEKPEWIQNPEWQFNNGKPMTFVGQICARATQTGLHDDAEFYLFWDKQDGTRKVVIQIA